MMINRAISMRFSALIAWLFVASVLVNPIQAQGTETMVSPITPPDVSASAVYVMDVTSGIPLYSKNPDERRPIGSVVKIMTALVTLKRVENPDEATVEITEYDMVDQAVWSNMNLNVGDTLTVTQLLYGLLLPSGGDALQVVAQGVNRFRGTDNGVLLITHYQRLLSYIVPDHVHVLANGRIVRSGDKELALTLEEKGYGWLGS